MRRRHKAVRMKKAEIKKEGVSLEWPNMFGKGTGIPAFTRIASRDGQIYEIQPNGSMRKAGTVQEENEKRIISPKDSVRLVKPTEYKREIDKKIGSMK